MGHSSLDDLERSQKVAEYILAALVPGLLALMLFSYLLFDPLFLPLLGLSIAAACAATVPARRMHRLQFLCWSRNTFPVRMTDSLIGMVYISAVSVFSVTMLSEHQGLRPESPLALATLLGLLVMLMALLAFNARNRDRFLGSEKRAFAKERHRLESGLTEFLRREGRHYRKVIGKRRSRIELESGLVINVSSMGRGTEVVIERADSDPVTVEGLKGMLT